MTTFAKVKWFLFLLLALLLVIVGFQNLEVVEVRILLWDGKLTKALLLAGTTFLGFLMGLLARPLWHIRPWRKQAKMSKTGDHAA